MSRSLRPVYLVACVLLGLISFPGLLSAEEKENTSAADEPQLESCQLGHIQQVHRFGDIYLAGQPTPEDLTQFKADGFDTVINLRTDGELSWDEAKAAKQAGLKYLHVPFQGEAELTPKVFEKVLPVLNDKESGPKLLHCGSANRVGALWYAHRVLNDGVNPVEAELEAKKVGLRNEAYLKKAKEYIAAQRSPEEKAPAANE